MTILLTGGFFGSGKTTVLSRISELLLEQGYSLCIIENEIGEKSIDDLLLKKADIEISTILGGCVCCQVTGSLIEALNRIKAEITPDWVLVELTGTAFLDTLRNTIEAYAVSDDPIITLSVVDAARWQKLIKIMHPMISRQVAGADIVVINKIDQCFDIESVFRDIQQIVDNPCILPIQATVDSVAELVEQLKSEAARYA